MGSESLADDRSYRRDGTPSTIFNGKTASENLHAINLGAGDHFFFGQAEQDIVLNGGKGDDIYDVSGFATVYDNGGQNNIYNLAQYADVNFHLSASSSGVLNIEGDSKDIIFARQGHTLMVENVTDGTYAFIKHYFDGGETSISAFTSDDGMVLGSIDLEKGSNESFENLMI